MLLGWTHISRSTSSDIIYSAYNSKIYLSTLICYRWWSRISFTVTFSNREICCFPREIFFVYVSWTTRTVFGWKIGNPILDSRPSEWVMECQWGDNEIQKSVTRRISFLLIHISHVNLPPRCWWWCKCMKHLILGALHIRGGIRNALLKKEQDIKTQSTKIKVPHHEIALVYNGMMNCKQTTMRDPPEND